MKNLSQQIMETRRRPRSLIGKNEGLPFELSLNSTDDEVKKIRRMDKDRVEQFNNDVKAWSIRTTSVLRMNVRALVKNDRKLSDSIEPNIYFDRKYRSEVNRIGFSFAREGVYIHKGAGRGYGGFRGGSKWTDLYGRLKTTDPKSFFKMGSGKRRRIEWFDPVIQKELPALADIVAEYCADMAIDASRIYIKN